jgi:hypothetical protein
MPPLMPAEVRRLVGILGRLGSDHDGERAAAGLLATRMLRAAGLGWDDVIASGSAARPDMAWAAGGGAAAPGSDLALCLRHLGQLNGWEQQFIRSMATMMRRSPGQARKLSEIADALRKNGAK